MFFFYSGYNFGWLICCYFTELFTKFSSTWWTYSSTAFFNIFELVVLFIAIARMFMWIVVFDFSEFSFAEMFCLFRWHQRSHLKMNEQRTVRHLCLQIHLFMTKRDIWISSVSIEINCMSWHEIIIQMAAYFIEKASYVHGINRLTSTCLFDFDIGLNFNWKCDS